MCFVSSCDFIETSLEGTWLGEDTTGKPVFLKFGPDGAFSIGQDMKSETQNAAYMVVADAVPSQMYLKINKENELIKKVPFGVYKIEDGKLTLCMAKAFQKTIGFMPFGAPRFEMPKELSGDCIQLRKVN